MDGFKDLELFDCDLCKRTIKFYPEGKCPWIKYKKCKIRLAKIRE